MPNSRLYSLRIKLIAAFLAVALIPLLLLAFLNIQSTQRDLTNSANQSLLAAASQTANSIDTFINTNLNAVRVEAILPGLSQYLQLSEVERRSRNQDEVIASTTLLSLSRKDAVNIISYALLDLGGKNILDTYTPGISSDESQHDYFIQPLKTGYPYASAMRLSNRVPGQVTLYFSSPVRDATGKILGVLRLCYNATGIQQLVTRQTDLTGPQSFAVLLDENYIRLADGKSPEFALQPIVPLAPDRVKALQAENRLTRDAAASLVKPLPELQQGLEQASAQPLFTTRLVETDDRPTAVAVASLKTQPWLVLFAQPKAVFLAPIQSQILSALLLALLIASGVTLVAILAARILTKPLIQLTTEVSRAIASDESLSLIAQLEQSHPESVRTNTLEIWNLQRSFTRMRNSLLENWQQLETQISENTRMATELDVTRQLQYMLLPKPEELNHIRDLEIASFMEPATEVGGDYYDVLQCNEQIKIGIGDVTGHGLESGMLMLMVQAVVRTLLVNQETDPFKFWQTLNQVIYDNAYRMNCDRSLTLALLDYHDGHIRISGQHEQMLVVRHNGEIEAIDTIDLGMPIGLIPDITKFIAQKEVRLHPGDGVVLYTDGITEAENRERVTYGLERLMHVVSHHWHSSANEIKQAVVDDIRQHIDGHKVYDDITLLILKQR